MCIAPFFSHNRCENYAIFDFAVALGMELLIGGMFLKSGYVTPFPLMIPILIASFIVVITKAGIWISARAICRAIVGDLSQ